MHCPIDNTTLTIADRSGIEIDYCPQCRGVWLDRGELDKLIERSASQDTYRTPQTPSQPTHHYDNDHYSQHSAKPYKKKRESFLGDLFDF